MRGREFLQPARSNARGSTEAFRREGVVGAYYRIFLECRDALARWGRPVPPKQNVRTSVRLCFVYANDPDLKKIGDVLEELGRARNRAHYDLLPSPNYASPTYPLLCVQHSEDAINLLDAIEAGTGRLQKAVAALPP
jgi:hypothetical protein